VQAVLISFVSILAGVSNFSIFSSYEPAVTSSAILSIANFAAVTIIFTAALISNTLVFLFPVYRLSRTIETVPNL
jgi:hypothetical protein